MSSIPLPGPRPPVATRTDEVPGPVGTAGSTGDATGDLVVDAALAGLREVPDTDLDGLLAAGEHLQATLSARLSDLRP
ncbi:hypothetical protein [Nostocoides jenkinsii]|uniref:Uncharacterized protein n=1 Tax=Nostocoides jenkinsii Ben 74 TaxID=1193518 RepID=A0A077M7L0_9MICO|nr:hypothetical protein [Tetrasphaera jenkinsii]CCI51805.1 hypothetical protein BN13_1240025 [Tetrasphaera jenkinsii Ben 74]